MLEVLEGIEAQDGAAIALAAIFIEGEVETQFGIAEGGNEDGNLVVVGGLENAAAFGVLDEILADALVEFPTANNFLWIPILENAVDDIFDVIEIAFRLDGVVDAVVAGEKELVIVHLGGIVAEVRAAGGFDQTVSHERAGGDDGFDDAGFDEVAKDETHFANGESAGKSHDHETVLIASHGFEDIGGIADLSGSVGGVTHGTNEIVDGADFGKIEGKNGAELVLHRIVQDAARDGFLGFLGHESSSENLKVRRRNPILRIGACMIQN